MLIEVELQGSLSPKKVWRGVRVKHDGTDGTANTDGTAIERADGTANTGVN